MPKSHNGECGANDGSMRGTVLVDVMSGAGTGGVVGLLAGDTRRAGVSRSGNDRQPHGSVLSGGPESWAERGRQPWEACVMSVVAYTPLTPLAFLRRSAEVYPDKDAVVYAERRVSYVDFAAQTTRVARALRASGVQPGDRVAYLLPNLPEMLVAHFAVPLAGAVLVAINTRLSGEEVRYICDHSGSKLLVVDAALYPTAAPLAGELQTCAEIVPVSDPAGPEPTESSELSYAAFLDRGSDEPLSWTVEDENSTI